ncbi:MarR family winged helix-turn-helix transcriptional regulator [Microlunatus speluncae]|uniref:MarR family winged helix-turn-helix transcriptional regulator n=1 Tax=Microlunatus speluncae TaxID=2594267 RepID=UPI001375E223|nr:MarR family winged helix-turn-helix transcriptional regulator [Microlunatus speluncae]
MTDYRDTLSYRLVRLGRETGAKYAARLRQMGLRPLHVRLLTAIRAADRTPQNEHAANLGITGGFVVRLADDLERMGAVARERDTQDRRRQFLVITATGESLLREATLAATGLDEDLARGLSPDALTQLAESLDKIRASLASGEDCTSSA